jgi:hypothetical protein
MNILEILNFGADKKILARFELSMYDDTRPEQVVGSFPTANLNMKHFRSKNL